MLGLEHGQRTQRGEVGPALRCGPAQHVGFGVAPYRLEDRRSLRLQRGSVRTASSRGVEVGKGLEKTVEGGPCPGLGEPGRSIVRRVAHQLLGPLRIQRGLVRTAPPRGVEVGECLGEAMEGGSRPGPGEPGRAVVRRGAHQQLGQAHGLLIVGDAAQHVPAQNEQVDQEGLFGHRRPCKRRLPQSCRRGPRRQTVDLRLQVRQGDDPTRGSQSAVVVGQPSDDVASSGGVDATASSTAFTSGGLGLGLFR